jgi:DNA/RNA endonuclease YhcR with UshA esterase domain
MKKYLWIFILAAIIFIGALYYGIREFTRTHVSLDNIKPVASLTVGELLTAFSQDEKATNEMYAEKVLQVKGLVSEIEIDDEDGSIDVYLEDELTDGNVICEMSETSYDKAKALKIGDIVTIKGVCAGYMADDILGSDVILVRCVIE